MVIIVTRVAEVVSLIALYKSIVLLAYTYIYTVYIYTVYIYIQYIYIYSIYIYRVSQEEWTKVRESVPYVKI